MKMKRLIIGISLLILAIAPSAVCADGLGELRMTLVEGDIQLWDDEAREWIPVAVNMPLREGDRLWVPDEGRAEIQARNGTYVRLNERTAMDLLRSEQDSLQLYLSQGQVHVNFPGSRDSIVQIDTPMSTVRSYERARFGIDVFRRGDTDISVYDGEVYVESSRGRTMLREGRQLSLGDDYSEIFSLGRETAWERWNRERDSRLAGRRYRDDYLPEELRFYGGDFDEYGRWVYAREYGYVWTPTFSVHVGWSPYRDGRWIWRGGDYVWLSYEPWGWVPYHYGRWTFVVNIGWCWVPPARGSVFWGPGYVGWVYTPTYVAWVPLAPREIYYGYGYYGPYSINIINIRIGTTRVRHDYRNVRVKNAVIALDHDSFRRGHRTEFRVRENPFHEHSANIGRPRIAPVRESYLPVVRDIPETKRPPRVISDVRVKEIRQERPFVKQENAPVLNPDRYEKFRKDWRREREKYQEQERDLQRERERTRKLDEQRRGVLKEAPEQERTPDRRPAVPSLIPRERSGKDTDARDAGGSSVNRESTGEQNRTRDRRFPDTVAPPSPQPPVQDDRMRRMREPEKPADSARPAEKAPAAVAPRTQERPKPVPSAEDERPGTVTPGRPDIERYRRGRNIPPGVPGDENRGVQREQPPPGSDLRQAPVPQEPPPLRQRAPQRATEPAGKRIPEGDKKDSEEEQDKDKKSPQDGQQLQPQQQMKRDGARGAASGRYSWQEDQRNTPERNRRGMF